jgi:hypothetical protein
MFHFERKTIFLLPLLIISLGFWTFSAHAQVSTGIVDPFGGRILAVIECDEGLLLTIGPPTPAEVMFVYGASTPYAWYQFWHPGPWSLGYANNLIQIPCTIGGEVYLGNYPMIIKIGTSLI